MRPFAQFAVVSHATSHPYRCVTNSELTVSVPADGRPRLLLRPRLPLRLARRRAHPPGAAGHAGLAADSPRRHLAADRRAVVGDHRQARRGHARDRATGRAVRPPARSGGPTPGRTTAFTAMRAAIFAQQAGRTVAFSLAAFRQAFAGGKDLSDVDNVLIAAAACELHPNAVLKGIEMQSTKDRLRAATHEAYERGVRGVPSVVDRRRALLGRRPARGGGRRPATRSPLSAPRTGAPRRIATGGHRVLSGPMATREQTQSEKAAKEDNGDGASPADVAKAEEIGFGEVKHDLPDEETCRTVLSKMMLIRRFEERAGEMYAKAKIGGFLHLCIGEEATDRRRHPGAPGHRLPDVDLPRARPGARPRHPSERRDGRAVRPRGRLLGRPRRLDAPVRLGQALPRRLRHRRRQPAARPPASRSPATTRRPTTRSSR